MGALAMPRLLRWMTVPCSSSRPIAIRIRFDWNSGLLSYISEISRRVMGASGFCLSDFWMRSARSATARLPRVSRTGSKPGAKNAVSRSRHTFCGTEWYFHDGSLRTKAAPLDDTMALAAVSSGAATPDLAAHALNTLGSSVPYSDARSSKSRLTAQLCTRSTERPDSASGSKVPAAPPDAGHPSSGSCSQSATACESASSIIESHVHLRERKKTER